VKPRTDAFVDRTLVAIEQRVIIPLLAFLLAFITVGVFVQVVMRYGFSMSFLWGEELSLFAFIWSVFLGAAVGVRRKIHLGFDFLPELLTGRWAIAQRLTVNLSILAVAVLLLVEGWTFSLLSVRRLSPALGISLFVPTLVIPISGGLMVLIVLRDLARDVRQFASGRSS
jgi:TRAP-type C4-dicarboxylate transport system permease small subunit